MRERQVILFIAMSLDGYIATADGDIRFLSVVDAPGEDYGYGEFIRGIDTVIMGRKTYEKVLSFGIEFPHRDLACYVLSRTRTGRDAHVTFFGGEIEQLIGELRATDGGDIFIDGGAETVHGLLTRGFIDQFVISVIPVLLGDGIRLFGDGRPGTALTLRQCRTWPSGLAQLWYARK